MSHIWYVMDKGFESLLKLLCSQVVFYIETVANFVARKTIHSEKGRDRLIQSLLSFKCHSYEDKQNIKLTLKSTPLY